MVEIVKDVECEFVEFGILRGSSDFLRLSKLTFTASGGDCAHFFVEPQREHRRIYHIFVEKVDIHVARARFYRAQHACFVCDAEKNRHVFGRFFQRFENLVLRLNVHKIGAVNEIDFSVRERFHGHRVEHAFDVVNLDFAADGVEMKTSA